MADCVGILVGRLTQSLSKRADEKEIHQLSLAFLMLAHSFKQA